MDVGLTKALDDVAACLWLELPLQQVFLSGKVRLEILKLGILCTEGRTLLFVGAVAFCLVFLALEFVELLIVDALLALQQLQSHIGGTKVAAYAYQVGVVCTVAIDHFASFALADAGDADGKSRV